MLGQTGKHSGRSGNPMQKQMTFDKNCNISLSIGVIKGIMEAPYEAHINESTLYESCDQYRQIYLDELNVHTLTGCYRQNYVISKHLHQLQSGIISQGGISGFANQRWSI